MVASAGEYTLTPFARQLRLGGIIRRNALVTGAAGGIGRATVETFAAAGWETIAVDRREAGDFPSEVVFRQADVSDPNSVAELFAWLRERTDGLAALINNAAIQIRKPFAETTVQDWDASMASNLSSVFLMAKEAHSLLRAAKGAIVNVSSVHAVATSVDSAAYAASKGGVLEMTRAMAMEFASDRIRVNVVLPGAVDTPMLRAGLERRRASSQSIDDQLQDLGARTPLGRVGKPAEIAKAILFLADNQQSSYITGEALIVDGGATARLSVE